MMMMMGIQILFLLALLIRIQLVTATISQTSLYNVTCSDTDSPNSVYQYNLHNLLGTLTIQASKTGFYNSSMGQRPDQVYALYMCRGDVDGRDCSDCVTDAKDTIIDECPYQTSALIWYEKCMLRYSNQSFFGRMVPFPEIFLTSTQSINGNKTRFRDIMGNTMNDILNRAINQQTGGMKFATKVVNVTRLETLYALAQCTPDLSSVDCYMCLTFAIVQLNNISMQGARVLEPSCNVRYEIYPFFNLTADSALPPPFPPSPLPTNITHPSDYSTKGRRPLLRVSLLIVLPTSIAILLLFGIWIIRMHKKKTAETLYLEIDEMRTAEILQFELDVIRAATRNFSVDNRLGEGGFGEVYKGALEDGREVAVKRLSKKSVQGIDEFKTEIILVAKLQHNNLVKLLGFCLTSMEKILVYEFLPNSSLDRFLFNDTKKLCLNWEIRFKIIVGIARGLLYLHEDSRLKVIHRDLKSSNILLDEVMNPKISDFGLAKLFGVDQTQGDTKRIVGTYGYMAPEYAVTGHFSVKSDVYSFGIIVLEIVSGQRNRFFGRPQLEEALLHRAWRLWNEKKALDLVDTTLENDYPREEVRKCIHIGLLCIQEKAIDRPRMASVVAALSGQSISLPVPKPPHFFGNTSSTTDIISPHHYYNQQINGDEIEYNQALDQQQAANCKHVYTGTQMITDLYPR